MGVRRLIATRRGRDNRLRAFDLMDDVGERIENILLNTLPFRRARVLGTTRLRDEFCVNFSRQNVKEKEKKGNHSRIKLLKVAGSHREI